MLQRQS